MSETERAGGLPPPRFLIDAPWFRNFIGARVIGGWVRWVIRTARPRYFPPDYLQNCAALEPAIYVAWHANVLATPLLAPDMKQLVTMSSPHPDGRMGAALAESFGLTTINATGVSFKQSEGTGGVAGFRSMLRVLKSGKSIFLNAEVPPTPGRLVGRGVVALARISGRPIIPVAAASRKRKIIERLWDKMQVNYPNSEWAVVGAPVMWVNDEVDDDAVMTQLKADLDAAYAKALELADAELKA
ncbi:MAG TPA: DUF374 domain-containing protein [Arsenicitalea sp.]|nr:DUF374 domain-containing protein [Arsenicitalea sp.]